MFRAPNQSLPSGEQWTIRHGDHEAVVVQVGGGLRTYAFRGRDVLAGYPPDEQCSAGRGQLLMPWPNRIRDGRYSSSGQSRQLALSEPDRGNAIHGLVRWASWSVLAQTQDTITLVCQLRPQQGWGWNLDLFVTYALTDEGLIVTPCAINVGAGAAPFGFGAHPYLIVGEDRVDEVRLGIPAGSLLEVDDRLLPKGIAAVEGTDRDFRQPRLLGETALDTAFTNVADDLRAGRLQLRRRPDRPRARAGVHRVVGDHTWLGVAAAELMPFGLAAVGPDQPRIGGESRRRPRVAHERRHEGQRDHGMATRWHRQQAACRLG